MVEIVETNQAQVTFQQITYIIQSNRFSSEMLPRSLLIYCSCFTNLRTYPKWEDIPPQANAFSPGSISGKHIFGMSRGHSVFLFGKVRRKTVSACREMHKSLINV